MKKLLVLGCACLVVFALASSAFAYDKDKNRNLKGYGEFKLKFLESVAKAYSEDPVKTAVDAARIMQKKPMDNETRTSGEIIEKVKGDRINWNPPKVELPDGILKPADEGESRYSISWPTETHMYFEDGKPTMSWHYTLPIETLGDLYDATRKPAQIYIYENNRLATIIAYWPNLNQLSWQIDGDHSPSLSRMPYYRESEIGGYWYLPTQVGVMEYSINFGYYDDRPPIHLDNIYTYDGSSILRSTTYEELVPIEATRLLMFEKGVLTQTTEYSEPTLVEGTTELVYDNGKVAAAIGNMGEHTVEPPKNEIKKEPYDQPIYREIYNSIERPGTEKVPALPKEKYASGEVYNGYEKPEIEIPEKSVINPGIKIIPPSVTPTPTAPIDLINVPVRDNPVNGTIGAVFNYEVKTEQARIGGTREPLERIDIVNKANAQFGCQMQMSSKITFVGEMADAEGEGAIPLQGPSGE